MFQKRFLYSYEAKDNSGLWWIPISYISDTRNNFDVLDNYTSPEFWLWKEKEEAVTIDAKDWYLLNVKQTGNVFIIVVSQVCTKVEMQRLLIVSIRIPYIRTYVFAI